MLLAIIGPTCSGKSTLEKKLVETGEFERIISFTTRKPRQGEVNGKDYYFIDSKPELDEVVELNLFNGNYYGVYIDELLDKINTDKNVVIVVDPNGLQQFKVVCKEYNIEISSIYLKQDINTLTKRLLNRYRTDNNAELEVYSKRMISMFSEWLTWPNAVEYDMVFEDFGKDTEAEIIRLIREVYSDKN